MFAVLTSANAPRRWDGAVLATLKGAQSISKSGFTPQLRSGAVNTGIRHPLKFRPVNVVQAYDWRVCGADDHKTDLCPKLTATVLDTPTGQHPRTRALVSTAEVNGAFLKMHWRTV